MRALTLTKGLVSDRKASWPLADLGSYEVNKHSGFLRSERFRSVVMPALLLGRL